jgi:hypothetical protein
MTVGTAPTPPGGWSRPLIEMCWRAVMVLASLEPDPVSGRWRKSHSYDRLDPSEKSAVSYFLGLTQAKITCELLLGVPHLVHLDAVLTVHGMPIRDSRPDLIGFDPVSRAYGIAVEAKGRTNGRTADVTAEAKKQAGLLPPVPGVPSGVGVASVSSFDTRGRWQAYLEDPPRSRDSQGTQGVGPLLVAYYRPLVSALQDAGIDREASDRATVVARLPGMDMSLGLPADVVSIMSQVQATGPVPTDRLHEAAAELTEAITGDTTLPGMADAVGLADRDGQEEQSPSYCTGLDGVSVELGPSWFPLAQQ